MFMCIYIYMYIYIYIYIYRERDEVKCIHGYIYIYICIYRAEEDLLATPSWRPCKYAPPWKTLKNIGFASCSSFFHDRNIENHYISQLFQLFSL